MGAQKRLHALVGGVLRRLSGIRKVYNDVFDWYFVSDGFIYPFLCSVLILPKLVWLFPAPFHFQLDGMASYSD